MDYLDLVTGLLLPDLQSTMLFADHVAENHSWYKHLPFFPPGALFVFFLNPHAGRGVHRDDEGNVSHYDIQRGEYFEHHSRLTTAEYRDRFGHWDYWVDDNPRVPICLPGPWISDLEDRERELLPGDTKRRWSCRLTAFLKPMPSMFRSWQDELERDRDAFLDYAAEHPQELDAARYQALPLLAKGSINDVFGHPILSQFVLEEFRLQGERVLETLIMIREDLVAGRSR